MAQLYQKSGPPRSRNPLHGTSARCRISPRRSGSSKRRIGRARAGAQPAAADETRKIDERIAEVTKRLNKVYADWNTNLRLVPPPAPVPVGFFEKWLAQPAKKEMRAFIVRCVNQKGLALTDRMTIKKVEGVTAPSWS